MAKRGKETGPVILDGKFFSVESGTSTGTVTAQCNSCSKKIKGTFQSTSNFITHLRVLHPEALKEYEVYKKTGLDIKRQKKLEYPVIGTSCTFQHRAENLILKFVVNTMSPISIVENTDFRNLFSGLGLSIKVPTVLTFKKQVRLAYEVLMKKIMDDIAKITWVSVTADIWSAHNRSFMGVTCHWISSDFSRKSVVLALKRFKGRHTAITIMQLLSALFAQYQINGKISAVVTDNGSNFVKAFKDYGLKSITIDEEDEAGDAAHEDLYNLLDEEAFTTLPNHVRCASHTLSLVATTDLENELDKRVSRHDRSKTSCKKLMRSSLSKCSSFWNKASRSVQVAEKIKDEIGVSLTTPCKTRWNSTFDSVQQLVTFFDKLDSLFVIASVDALKPQEKEFLKGYYEGLKPVAWALDKLQAEKNMYFGYLAPVILRTRNKLRDLEEHANEFVGYISSSILVGLMHRFGFVLEFSEDLARSELLAAMTLPQIKLNWVPEDKKNAMKTLLINEAKKVEIDTVTSNCDHPPDAINSDDDDLFDFEPKKHDENFEDAELECIRYLNDPNKQLDSLSNYKRIKAIFTEYNTVLPSSAPAERLFSYGKMILRPQRARLSDEYFEYFLFLKLNSPEKEDE